MNQVKIKICGLTRSKDVDCAVAAGVDAVGFVFTASARRVSPLKAMELCSRVPGDVLRVGLFLDQAPTEIERVLNTVTLDVLQFHGSETAQQCSAYGLPYLKAVAMQNSDSFRQAVQAYPGAMGLLLDSHVRGEAGGSGKVFDWHMARSPGRQVWLAGGLNADNVGQAIRMVRPYAVDVSSGVEALPGVKDATRIGAFVRAVKQAARQMEEECVAGTTL